jgi:uncharacterized lipoprotein NlpE involved in copper resistance
MLSKKINIFVLLFVLVFSVGCNEKKEEQSIIVEKKVTVNILY